MTDARALENLVRQYGQAAFDAGEYEPERDRATTAGTYKDALRRMDARFDALMAALRSSLLEPVGEPGSWPVLIGFAQPEMIAALASPSTISAKITVFPPGSAGRLPGMAHLYALPGWVDLYRLPSTDASEEVTT